MRLSQTLPSWFPLKLDLSRFGESNPIREVWDRLSGVPGGTLLFSRFLGMMAPYSGTIKAHVVELRHGYARVRMEDRRAVRNHLDSVHAIALMNLAEITTGVAMMYGIPDDARGILRGLSIEYLKKARGTIQGECQVDPPDSNDKRSYVVEAVLTDSNGEVVARAKADWLIGPKR